MPNILDALKADHGKAKKLLTDILETQDLKNRDALFLAFKLEITAHSRAEEKTFYRSLEKTSEGKEEALEGTVEHEVVDNLIAQLADPKSNADPDQWLARCRVLLELLERHIEEEEGAFFETARKLFDRTALDQMAVAFIAEKAKYGIPAKTGIAAE